MVIIPEIDKVSHIFSASSKKLKNSKIIEKVSISIGKTDLGKKIMKFINEKNKIVENNFIGKSPYEETVYQVNLSAKYEIPVLIRKNIESRNKIRVKFSIEDELIESFERVFMPLRGEKIKPKVIKEINSVKNKPVIIDDDEDIFSDTENNKPVITNKLKLTNDSDDDIFKLKEVDLSTLLKPFEKVKK